MVTQNSWNSQDPVQVALGGTGVATISSGNLVVGAGTSPITTIAYSATGGTSNIVARDASGNSASNNFTSGSTAVTSASGTTVLTAASTRLQVLQGSQIQTFQLPNATTLSIGARFEFNNNSTGVLTVVDAASGPVTTIPSGGYATVIAIAVSTSAGAWDKHFSIPANGNYGTAGMVITGDLAVSTLSGVMVGNNASNISAVTPVIDGVLISSHAAGVPSWLANGTAGYLLTAQSGAPPAWAAAPPSGLSWSQITSNTTAVAFHGYQVTSGTPTITLPSTAAVGDMVGVMLSGGTSFVVRTSSTGVITLGGTSSSSNPASIQSIGTGEAVTLICKTANTGWQALSSVGNFNFTVI